MAAKRKSRPMYEIIQNDIIQKIQTGVYQEGDLIPSENELTEIWKVSRTTATKALTELSLGGYIYRIQGKGSFANPLVSHLTPGKYAQLSSHSERASRLPHKIGIIIPTYYDYHSGSIIRGISDTLRFPSYFINIALSYKNNEEEFALNTFLQDGYSGIILFPTNFEVYSDIILQMSLNKYPLVVIDRSFPGIPSMSVTCDNKAGCELCISHLLSLGHKNIAFIADEPYREQITKLRYDSYLNFMSVRRLPCLAYENFFHAENASEMHADFLQRVRCGDITAVVASNADALLRLHALCQENGICIPDQLSALCFDNPDSSDHTNGTFFTYLEQNSYEMGKQAALLLHQTLSDDNKPECKQIVLQPTIVPGRSTQPLKP